MSKSLDEKFKTVIEKNTFYYFNRQFEESYEGHINSVRETLLLIKNKIETRGLIKEVFIELLAENPNGLSALLTLTGFSSESFMRLITLIRAVDDPLLTKLTFKNEWRDEEDTSNVEEWKEKKILKKIQENEYFRAGIVNIFFEGSTLPYIENTMPLFELKKLGISKLNFEIPSLIDTLVRYKVKGSYSAKKGNNPEEVVAEILERLGLPHETGDLKEWITNAPDTKRTMDFIIPNKTNPIFIAESSFLVTTSSGQGDKSKTEISIRELIKQHYPKAKFIGFVDGIGWYVRKGDLKRMVTAYEDVFTFHKDELKRFEKLLIETFKK